MKLSKIQKFLKENNINYSIQIDNNGLADIRIKDDKTIYTSISEITGNRGKNVSGIMLFGKEKETNKSFNITFSSQTEIVKRLEKDIT